MICQGCKQDLPIERFGRTAKSKRRSRRCSGCKRSATCNVKRWHKKGRECSRCGETRPCPEQITDFPWRPGVCQPCIDAKARARTSEWARWKRKIDPEWRARQVAASIRWQHRHPDRVREANRQRFLSTVADAKRHERLKEDQRMRYRLKREREGKPAKPMSAAAYVARYGNGFGNSRKVPSEPLVEPLRRAVEEIGQTAFSDVSGVSPLRIHEIVNERTERISMVNADKLCTHLGIPFNFIYPDL